MRRTADPRSSQQRHLRRLASFVPCLLALQGGSAHAEPTRTPEPSPASQVPDLAPTEPTAQDASATSDDPTLRLLLELAKGRFNQGVLTHDAASVERALDALHLGMAISSAPGLLYNAARVEQQLGHCAEATDLYQRFLAGPAASAGRERAERQLEQLGACDAAQPTQSAWILPGWSQSLQPPPALLMLHEPPVAWATLEDGPDAPAPLDTGRIVAWSLVGAAGVCAVLTGVFLAQAYTAQKDIDDLQDHPDDPDAGSRLSELQEQGQSAQLRAQVFGVLTGSLGLAGGVGLWWTSRASGAARLEPAQSGSHAPARSSGVAATWSGTF